MTWSVRSRGGMLCGATTRRRTPGDSGEGHHPGVYEWPVILLGTLGGKLKTNGRCLQLPHNASKKHRTTAARYCTPLHPAVEPRDKFGVNDPGIKQDDQTGAAGELLA